MVSCDSISSGKVMFEVFLACVHNFFAYLYTLDIHTTTMQ